MAVAPRPSKLPVKATWFWVLGVAAAAVAIGAVFLTRGPDLSVLPVMADREIALPEGGRIYVQRHEVTVREWNLCVAQNGCTLALRTRPDQDPSTTPATGLNFVDTQEYIAWINAATGHTFRLPTAEEWEHIAAPVMPEKPDPLFTDPSMTWASAYLVEGIASRALKPQGSFSTTPDGIADLDGSVWEWTQGCYVDDKEPDRCPAFFVGGEHVAAMSFLVRDPARGGCAVGTPPAHLGMRLVRDAATGG